MTLTERTIRRARELGADLVGIAPVERFAGAPYRMSPQGLLPGAKSVIVAAIHHLDAAVELGGEPSPHDVGPYGSQSSAMNPRLDDISFWLARFLENEGHRTLPIAASNIWRYKGYKDLRVNFAPDLAHRYAAVAAGLGEIGWSGLALTPQFGPRQRFVSVITEAELEPSPMYEGEPLCDRCMECVEHCPTDAFRKEVQGRNRIEIGGREFEFPNTNKWRCAWAENFCLSLDHRIPDEINEAVILAYLEKYGPRGGEEGCCLKFCMSPALRYADPDYCRAPRRKKTAATAGDRLGADLDAVIGRGVVDTMAVAAVDDFANDFAVKPERHLPDARTVISLAADLPDGHERSSEVASAVRQWLGDAAFEVAHRLDLGGYSAVTSAGIPDNLVAQRLGIHKAGAIFTTVLTSAPLPARVHHRARSQTRVTARRIREWCLEAGADLAGFFGTARFADFSASFARAGLVPDIAETVSDVSRTPYGPYVPAIERRSVRLRGPRDLLPDARSVIVLGLQFPHASLDIAKTTPAETAGPFAFVQYETLRLLGQIALKVVRLLNDAGNRSTFTFDLTGLASQVRNPRGMLPDMRANLYPAVLAGLAYPGLHGHPLTPEFGVRQRFVAIVTDRSLQSDELYAGPSACDGCARPCVEACPTAALAGEPAVVAIDGVELAFPRIDHFACDWAKRYTLAGKEGPEYSGLDVNVPLPEERTGAAIAAAVSSVDWGVQKRHPATAEECLRVCAARGER
jgi:epoxyqueuosine reductase